MLSIFHYLPLAISAFEPSICRSLVIEYNSKSKYNGIPVSRYEADFSSAANTKQCFCRAEDECPPKGTIDLYKCAGTPMFMSMPHFYMGDEKLINNIESGLNPDKEKHGIYLMFEGVSFCYSPSLQKFRVIIYSYFLDNWKCFGRSKALSIQFRSKTNSRN